MLLKLRLQCVEVRIGRGLRVIPTLGGARRPPAGGTARGNANCALNQGRSGSITLAVLTTADMWG